MTEVSFLRLICMLTLCYKIALGQSTVMSTINQNENTFFRSGTVSLTVSASTTTNETRTIVTYVSPLASSTYQLMTSIKSFDQGINLLEPTVAYNITIITKNISRFEIKLYSVVMSLIAYAKINYFCINNAIRNLQFYVLQNYFGNGIPGTLPAQFTNTDFLFNFTSKINRSLFWGNSTYIVQPFIKGFKIINWNANAFSIELIATVLNSSYYQIDVKSSILTTQQVTDLYAQVLIYNSTWIQSHVTRLDKYSVSFTQTSQTYNSFGIYSISENNFFFGVKGFRFSYPTLSFYFDFFFDFPSNQVQLNGLYPSLQFIVASIISVELRQCLDPLHPYFMNSTYKCYSSCPTERQYEDEPRKQCAWCMHDCYTCEDGSNCTSCNITSYFRENDMQTNGTLRCKPISGYYNTRYNDSVAKKCDINCVQCILYATNCTICKSNQYMSKVDYNGTCNNCPTNCTTCTDSLTCTSCDRFYGLDSLSLCVPVCTQNCSQCHIATTPVVASVCDICQYGYYPNPAQVSECFTICGDGIFIQVVQKCDDNNTLNGDGCNSQCKIQLGYNCYVDSNNISLPQKCYYEQEVRFSLKRFKKYPKRNSFMFDLSLSTLNPSVLKQLDWSKIISIDVEYFWFGIIDRVQTFTDAYNSTIRTLVLTFEVDYKPTIKSFIQIQVDPKRNNQPLVVSQGNFPISQQSSQYKIVSALILNPNKFDTTPITKQTLPLKSENKIAVIYQSDSVYTMAQILEYCLFGIAGMSLLLFPFSLTIYGGKILALQWLFVINCAYFSLVGFQNLQVYSTVQALSGLKLVALNFGSVEYEQYVNLWWTGLSNFFINNCLGLLCVIGLGIIYFIVMVILSRTVSDPNSLKKLEFVKKYYSSEEILITFYMIAAYGLTVNLLLSLFSSMKGINSDIMGIIIGMLLLILGVSLFILVIKRKNLLWQYKDHFYQNSIKQHYMNFAILTIWINAIFLVALKNIAFGNIVPIVSSIVSIACLIKLTPFKKVIERKRPIIVQVFNILVQSTFIILKIQLDGNDQLTQTSAFFLYLPFLVVVLLALGLGHTIYCFVIKMKNGIVDRKEFLENEKLYQKPQTKCNEPIVTSQSSQKQGKQDQPMDKQIMQSFRKQKGFNFISHALEYPKEELLVKWDNFQKVTNTKSNIDINKAKYMKKQMKRSLFLQGTNIESYFKFNFDPDGKEFSEESDKKSKDWQNGPYNNEKREEKLQSHTSGQNIQKVVKKGKDGKDYITYRYEAQKYTQEWAKFFKPKQLTNEEKKHSLAIYDMI